MNAKPLLNKIANVFAQNRFEAVMIGNAAAALHGATVTTLDIDFMFRKTRANIKKLKAVAKSFEASILKPYYPVSDLYRVINDEQGLQLEWHLNFRNPFRQHVFGSVLAVGGGACTFWAVVC